MKRDGLQTVDGESKIPPQDPSEALVSKGVDDVDEVTEEEAFLQEALDEVDTFLPLVYQEERLARQCLMALGQYHTLVIQAQAARYQGDMTTGDKLWKEAMKSKSEAAIIQKRHPATKELYKTIAEGEAAQLRAARTG